MAKRADKLAFSIKATFPDGFGWEVASRPGAITTVDDLIVALRKYTDQLEQTNERSKAAEQGPGK